MAMTNEMLDELLGSVKTQDDLFGKDGLMKQISKRFMERLLEMEMTNHLGYMKHAVEGHHSGNSRNGKTKKIVKTGNGVLEIEVPRDRKSEFEPILVEKRQSHLKGVGRPSFIALCAWYDGARYTNTPFRILRD